MSEPSQVTAQRPGEFLQQRHALQLALLESARQLAGETSRFAQKWQGAWPDSTAALELGASLDAMRAALDGLVHEFNRTEGPARAEVNGLLDDLLRTRPTPGSLRRLQVLTQSDNAVASLEQQQLFGEVDALQIQLNALHSEWQDYLALVTPPPQASGSQPALRVAPPLALAPDPAHMPTTPLPPPFAPEEIPILPPLPPRPGLPPLDEDEDESPRLVLPFPPPPATSYARQRNMTDPFPLPPLGAPFLPDNLLGGGLAAPPAQPGRGGGLRRGLGGTLLTYLTLVAVLVLIIAVAYVVVKHQPQASTSSPSAPVPTVPFPGAPTATSAANPTQAPQPTDTPLPQPTSTPIPQPTATTAPAPGTAALVINPEVLLVPCPGTGAGTLQLVNTGAQPLDWRASVSSLTGGSPGIALDTTQGHLAVGGVALVNVSAQVQQDKGTISVSYSGGASPATVAYTVNC